jgi:hypothetical protein
MEQPQTAIQHPLGHVEGGPGGGLILLQLHFGQFHVPVGKFTPEEIVDLAAGFAKLVAVKEAVGGGRDLVEPVAESICRRRCSWAYRWQNRPLSCLNFW